jgi:hypothetical protein
MNATEVLAQMGYTMDKPEIQEATGPGSEGLFDVFYSARGPKSEVRVDTVATCEMVEDEDLGSTEQEAASAMVNLLRS